MATGRRGAAVSRPVILVVDDESELAVSYSRALRRRGHEIVSASTCAEALALLRERRPALVVSDVGLPDGDGMQIVRAAGTTCPPVPAIVITAQPSPRGRREALAAGAVRYLSKPVSMVALASLVEETLALRRDEHPGQARSGGEAQS